MYGLPFNHDGPVEDWAELRRHLEQLSASDVAVRVSVGPSADDPYLEARAKLKLADGAGDANRVVFALNTDTSREEGGLVSLRRDDFRGADLVTHDGDDYFHLLIRMSGVALRVQDTNSL